MENKKRKSYFDELGFKATIKKSQIDLAFLSKFMWPACKISKHPLVKPILIFLDFKSLIIFFKIILSWVKFICLTFKVFNKISENVGAYVPNLLIENLENKWANLIALWKLLLII